MMHNYTPVDVEELQAELERLNEQLQLAASYGQTLMQKVEALEDENAALKSENSSLVARAEDGDWRVRELNSDVARLTELLQDKQQELDQAQALLEVGPSIFPGSSAGAVVAVEEPEQEETRVSTPPHRSVTPPPSAFGTPAEQEEHWQQDQQAAADAQLAIEQEAERRREAEQSAKRLKEKLERAQGELNQESARAAEVMAERDAAAEKAEKERANASELQVRLAEMERQLKLAIAQSGAIADGVGGDDDYGSGQSLAMDLVGDADAGTMDSPLAAAVAGADVTRADTVAVEPAPPVNEEAVKLQLDLQAMLAAVQAAAMHTDEVNMKEESERWEGLAELFSAAKRLKLTDDHGIMIMKRNITRGSHTLPYFVEMWTVRLQDWAQQQQAAALGERSG